MFKTLIASSPSGDAREFLRMREARGGRIEQRRQVRGAGDLSRMSRSSTAAFRIPGQPELTKTSWWTIPPSQEHLLGRFVDDQRVSKGSPSQAQGKQLIVIYEAVVIGQRRAQSSTSRHRAGRSAFLAVNYSQGQTWGHRTSPSTVGPSLGVQRIPFLAVRCHFATRRMRGGNKILRHSTRQRRLRPRGVVPTMPTHKRSPVARPSSSAPP